MVSDLPERGTSPLDWTLAQLGAVLLKEPK